MNTWLEGLLPPVRVPSAGSTASHTSCPKRSLMNLRCSTSSRAIRSHVSCNCCRRTSEQSVSRSEPNAWLSSLICGSIEANVRGEEIEKAPGWTIEVSVTLVSAELLPSPSASVDIVGSMLSWSCTMPSWSCIVVRAEPLGLRPPPRSGIGAGFRGMAKFLDVAPRPRGGVFCRTDDSTDGEANEELFEDGGLRGSRAFDAAVCVLAKRSKTLPPFFGATGVTVAACGFAPPRCSPRRSGGCTATAP
mmetsp:Transcript_33058/g.91155  ORF Transcript_33058/g.91155 Transcript_33058/m.91155 type:complete len:247 (-) Transcript_33058:130-870(-)